MRKCKDCKIILEEDVRFCPKCGRELDDGAPTRNRAKTPNSVRSLLASADLHKLNEEWEQAIADATEALRLDPRRPETASMLASIYEHRDMLETAAIWYSTALELNPLSIEDQMSLDRVSKLKVAQEAAVKPGLLQALQERVWMVAGAAVGVVLLILLIVVLAGRVGPRRENMRPTAASKPSVILMLRVPGRASVATPQPPSEPPSGQANDLAGGTASSGTARTAAESTIMNALTASQPVKESGARVDDVIADPRQGVAIVTFSIAAKLPLSRNAILVSAASVTRATFAAHPDVKYVTSRCLVSTSQAAGTQIAFVGDAPRASSEALGASPTNTQLAGMFVNTWWNPQIRN